MNTEEVMKTALSLAGISYLPADSGIIIPGENIKKIIIGVDMENPELLLAREMGVDLVISHHPKTGSPQINFHNVMLRQIDKMVEAGIPINKAQKALKDRMAKIERARHSTNYDRVASFAELMKMPYMNIHMPADIITENFLQDFVDKKFGDKPRTILGDIVNALGELPEYLHAVTKPLIAAGASGDYAGKIKILMAGGTNGGEKVFKAYFEAGIGTIICMHVPDEVRQAVIEQNIGNVIVAGHMASDSIGLNILCKELESKGIEIIKTSGIVG